MSTAAESNHDAVVVLGLGLEDALDRLRKSEAAMYISPNPSLSVAARAAAAHIYASLRPQVSNPPPLEQLLVDPDSFDAEQVWAQLHLLYRPLFSHQRRHFRRLQNEEPSNPTPHNEQEEQREQVQKEEDRDAEDEETDEPDEEEAQDDVEEEEEEEEEDVGVDEEEKQVDEKGGKAVEDRFLSIQELQDYLEREEAKEYADAKKQEARRNDEEEEEEGDEDGGFEFGELEDADDDENTDGLGDAKYEDFFGGKSERKAKKKDDFEKKKQLSEKTSLDGSEYLEMNGEQEDVEDYDEDDDEQEDEFLSTHEKEQRKLHYTIQQMEKANIEPKSWTMQGEVTAVKRPKNSALEVDLDFEHNVRPAPVITEEVTASLEDLIKKRISEGHFDDVQRAHVLPTRAPKERKELDESKSKKGLAEIYEDEYAQTAGLASAPLSTTDLQKKEAGMLFKRICAKLDALAHFHFAPKPVIEDMSIQTNVPALAMEEIAPLAASDAAMLAPEEIFEGKGDIKEEGELTQADRKRRRANKKRKFKVQAGKREAKKACQNAGPDDSNGA